MGYYISEFVKNGYKSYTLAEMAEIVVVHGPPGSGKSEHSRRLASEGLLGKLVDHVSAGDRLRAIRMGKVASTYRDVVDPAPGQRVLLDHTIVTGMIFEYINQSSGAFIMLVDGYPRFAEAVDGFIEATQVNNHSLLGCVNLEISKRVSLERVVGRGTRTGEVDVSSSLAEKRYQEHLDFTLQAIGTLSRVTGVINVDAEPSMEVVWGSFCRAILALANK